MATRLYESYTRYKGWHRNGVSATDMRAYAREIVRAMRYVRTGCKSAPLVLEVGCGAGSFLAYCAHAAIPAIGLEVQEDIAAVARGAGLPVVVTSRRVPAHAFKENTFDVCCAFDVIEHCARDLLVDWMRSLWQALKPGGVFLGRSPNGGSPAGLMHFHGDLTHELALAPPAWVQLARATEFEVCGIFNAASGEGGGLAAAARRICVRAARDVMEHLWGRLYLGGRYPLDANLTCILRKPGQADEEDE